MGILDRLEIENFKSYAGKQVIGPFKQFTCIIGPNGSGKSNLMDAISFVLCDVSRNLRGQTIADLIYHIEGDPNPAKTASVSLIYRVTDDQLEGFQENDEIVFSRYITSRGTSHYRYNNKDISQEDYIKKLESINILVRAKNFLIFQGEIQNISNQSPYELSQLVETISGSSKYKDKYNEYRGKIEEMNMKINNVAFDKKSLQMEKDKIRNQKDEASVYIKTKEDLNVLQTDFFLWRLHHIEHSIDENYELINQTTEKKDKLLEQQEECKKEKMKYQKEKQLKRNEKASIENELKSIESDYSNTNDEIIKVNEEIKRLQKDLSQLNESIEKNKQEKEKNMEEKKQIQESINTMTVLMNELKEKIVQNEKGWTLRKEDEEEYYRLLQIYKQGIAKLKNDFDVLDKQYDNLKERINIQNDHISQYQLDIKSNEKNIQLCEEKTKTLEDLSEDRSKLIKETEKKLKEMETSHQKKYSLYKKKVVELEKVNEDVMSMQDINANTEKEKAMKELVIKLKYLFPNVIGRLYELCTPIQKKYETAISVALGSYMDAIVVKDDTTAIQCIEYLKQQHIPAIDIYPLNTLKPKPIKGEYRTLGSEYKLCIDLVTYDATIKPAVEYALNNIIVCKDMKDATYLAYTKGIKTRIITEIGDVISKNGSITGGVYVPKTKMLSSAASGTASVASRWDLKKYDDLVQKQTQLLEECNQLQSELNTIGNTSVEYLNLQNQLDLYKHKVEQLEREKQVNQQRYQQYTEAIQNMKAVIQTTQTDIQSLRTQLDTIQKKRDEISQQILQQQQSIFAPLLERYQVSSLDEFESIYINILNEKKNKIIEIESHLSKLNIKMKYIEQVIKNCDTKQRQIKTEIQTKQQTYHDCVTSKEQLANQLTEIQKKKDRHQNTMNSLLTMIHQCNDQLLNVEKEIQHFQKSIYDYSNSIQQFESEIVKLKGKRTTILLNAKVAQIEVPYIPADPSQNSGDIEMNNFVTSSQPLSQVQSQLDAEFVNKIDFSTLTKQNYCENEEDYHTIESEYKKEIENLTLQLESSSPDMKAFEKYNEVILKYKECYKQWEALIREKQTVEKQFETVKTQRKELYMSAYTVIHDHINRIYKQLTTSDQHPNGGMASLELNNTDEPYNSGIQYIVTPPDKTFRTIGELSGGERSIATLALLFTIHIYKPSPFYIMDEIDAALDKYNVIQISKFIYNLSKSIQCIIISLKDMFYYISDSLVGVYKDLNLQTSKTLTLDLTQYNDIENEEGNNEANEQEHE